MNLDELEKMLKKFFGGNFVSLSDATQAIFVRNPREDESGNLSYYSMTESLLMRYAKEGFVLITVPQLISMKQICELVPGMFDLSLLGEHQKFVLNRMMINPGRYLIKNEPRHLSTGAQLMREMGIRVEEHPKLIQVMYAYALCEILNRRILAEKIYVPCIEEVSSLRFGKTPICFQKGAGTIVRIGPWLSKNPTFNLLPVKGV